MRTIAITNQKGGCGKTTTTVNLAAAFAQKGLRTLLIDLDPQGHSTLGFGYDPETLDKTIYHALTNPQISISRVVLGTNIEKLDLAPSNILLSGAEIELAEVLGKELVLGEQLRMVNNDYDMVVIDCPPSVGLLTLNALVASTDVIVPVQVHCKYYQSTLSSVLCENPGPAADLRREQNGFRQTDSAADARILRRPGI